MTARQTGGQAWWRESGSRGADTLAPLPLGDSPAVILCLGKPSTSLILLLLFGPYSGHTPPSSPPLACIPPSSSSGGAFFNFDVRHFHAWGLREERRPHKWVKTIPPPPPLILVPTEASVVLHPVQALLHPLNARLSASAASVMEIKNKHRHTHTHWWTPMAASSRPEWSPTGLKTSGLEACLSWFWFFVILLLLYVDFVFVRWESLGEER